MSEDKIYSNPMPKDTPEDSTTGTNMSVKMSGEDQAKGNDQSSEEANCCQLNVDEMGLLKLKITILAVLCVILGSFLVAFQVLDKLGMLQEECDNATATAMTRTLEAKLTETEKMLIEQKNRNDNLTKENTKLKTELQGVRKCADDWEYFDGSCYHFSTDKKTWTESRDACVTMGGHLVIITSQQEMDFLKTKGEGHWIGLTDVHEEDSWHWVDNTPLTALKFWGTNQPDNAGHGEHCVMIDIYQNWNDVSCQSEFKRICESRSCRI